MEKLGKNHVIFAVFSFKPFVLDGFLASCNRKASIDGAEHAEYGDYFGCALAQDFWEFC
jgi:hypothetical protein